ncbi:MAG: universal stress protein [Solirubrobacteraceae bacterium]
MILVSYDGSADAMAAIDHAAQVMPGADTTVLTVWEPYADARGHSDAADVGLGFGGTYDDDPEIAAAGQQTALDNAADGTRRATAAGLVAESRIASGHNGIARAILAVAAEVDADVIVLGTRGLGGLSSFLLDSVSHEVVQHADRAVLVVPSSRLVEQRRGWARHADAALRVV